MPVQLEAVEKISPLCIPVQQMPVQVFPVQ